MLGQGLGRGAGQGLGESAAVCVSLPSVPSIDTKTDKQDGGRGHGALLTRH